MSDVETIRIEAQLLAEWKHGMAGLDCVPRLRDALNRLESLQQERDEARGGLERLEAFVRTSYATGFFNSERARDLLGIDEDVYQRQALKDTDAGGQISGQDPS